MSVVICVSDIKSTKRFKDKILVLSLSCRIYEEAMCGKMGEC